MPSPQSEAARRAAEEIEALDILPSIDAVAAIILKHFPTPEARAALADANEKYVNERFEAIRAVMHQDDAWKWIVPGDLRLLVGMIDRLRALPTAAQPTGMEDSRGAAIEKALRGIRLSLLQGREARRGVRLSVNADELLGLLKEAETALALRQSAAAQPTGMEDSWAEFEKAEIGMTVEMAMEGGE